MRVLKWVLLGLAALLLTATLLLLPHKVAGEPKELADSPALSPTDRPAPAPTPLPSAPVDADSTPKQTFVPIPTETVSLRPDGSTPSPTPAWATPYPSPTGSPTIENADEIRLGTVTAPEKGVYVRKKATTGSGALGTAFAGSQFTVLSEKDGWYRILYNGMEGYLPAENLTAARVNVRGTEERTYTVASLNVHCVGSDARLQLLAAALTAADADVVGLQELDRNTGRTGDRDWTKALAEAAGYPYYAFTAATAFDGGQFGTAILSRYPIIAAKSIKLDVYPGKEARALGYARILLPGGAADVFNTHLCASKMSFKSVNLASLAYELAATGLFAYCVTGDFNCSPARINAYLPEIEYANMDQNTFGDGSYPKIIDNILYTDELTVTEMRIEDTASTGATDHKMVVAAFRIPAAKE